MASMIAQQLIDLAATIVNVFGIYIIFLFMLIAAFGVSIAKSSRW